MPTRDEKDGRWSPNMNIDSNPVVTLPSEHIDLSSKQQTSKSHRNSTVCIYHKVYDVLSYTPKRCRYDAQKPFEFSMALNVLFGFAGCFTVANLYYTHPILNLLARDFNVTDEQASHITTLAQAGYATGLLFLCPSADLLKRRPFVLWLVWFTATMWIGLCLTTSYEAFCVISYITGVTTVTPQIMLPLIGDLAPANKRAMSLSIVVSGLILGMLLARLLSGVVSLYIGWRSIYWISLGLQYIILTLLWLFMPDYPRTNEGVNFWKKYPVLLWDVIMMFFKHPVVAQVCLMGFFCSATFMSYWTTLTFLLAGPPYFYSSLIIGLFALVGIFAMSWGPVFARLVMDKYVPLLSVTIGLSIAMIGVVIGTYTGKTTVAGPIIQAAFLEIGLQTSQIANRSAIYGVEPKARNRVNTAYMIFSFCGQLTGSSVGNALYARGGWIASGSLNVAFILSALTICLSRGPHEKGWIGWGGGYALRVHHEIEPQAPQDQQPKSETSTDIEKNAAGEAIMEPRSDSEKHSSRLSNLSDQTLSPSMEETPHTRPAPQSTCRV